MQASGAQSAGGLPKLRPELRLHEPGYGSAGDADRYLVEDPVRHRFLRIDATTHALLTLWPQAQSREALIANVAHEYGLAVAADDIETLIAFVGRNELTIAPVQGDWRVYVERRRKAEHLTLARLAHRYLFFRVPLFKPQRFLSVTAPLVAPVYSWAFVLATAFFGVVGLYLVSRQWNAFVSTFSYFFTWEGALQLGLALIAVKMLHELAHAYTAVRNGAMVPTIGVAFMVLTPLLYTDVTDTWRFKERRKRLQVDCAGIAIELIIACYATFLWAFLPDGSAKSVAFLLATAGWIMSVAINLNPFMRFDGYYILSELVGVDNLQTRSFAVGRWQLREVLFGLGEKCPEAFGPTAVRWLAVYAYAVWAYRLLLYLAIAILVYTYTFKLLGILLFVIEIVFLVGLPIWRELAVWWDMRAKILRRRRTAVTASIVAGLAALVFVPWSGRIVAPAVLAAADRYAIHAPRPARVVEVAARPGMIVAKGDVLLRLSAPDLVVQRDRMTIKRALVSARLARMGADGKERTNALVLAKELRALDGQLAAIEREIGALTVRARAAGQILQLAENLHPGRMIERDERLVLIGRADAPAVTAFVQARDIERLGIGTRGRFVSDNPRAATMQVAVTGEGVDAIEVLSEQALAEEFGGSIAVARDVDGRLIPNDAHYRVALSVPSGLGSHSTVVRGVVHLNGAPVSFAEVGLRQLARILRREMGF